MARVIKEGEDRKKGNASCPQCGKIVILEKRFGAPEKCPDCGVPYKPRPSNSFHTYQDQK